MQDSANITHIYMMSRSASCVRFKLYFCTAKLQAAANGSAARRREEKLEINNLKRGDLQDMPKRKRHENGMVV
jgi:cell division protein FtsB